MPLSDIVNVQITAQTRAVSQPGFGVLMILGIHKRFADLIRFYSNFQGVANDFYPTDPEYIAAQDFFAQPIVPTQLAIGRRAVSTATISVETAMAGFDYTTSIAGVDYTVSGTNTAQNSQITFSGQFQSGNFIKPTLNGVVQGTITSQLNFSGNFVSSNSIVATVNGTALSAVVFTSDQATTIAALAAQIALATGVASATVTSTDQITVVFTSAGQNTVNSVVTTGGASQPTVAIYEGSVQFDTNHLTTINALATLFETNSSVLSATVSGGMNTILTVVGKTNVTAVVNSVITTGLTTPPTAAIVLSVQPTTPETIANALVTLINDGSGGNPPPSPYVTATDNDDGSFTLASSTDDDSWTLDVSTTIRNPNQCRVYINQAVPNATYTVTLNGIQYSFIAPNNITSADQISEGLVTLINDDPNTAAMATDNGNGTFELQSVNGNAFSIFVSESIMQVVFGLIIDPLGPTNSISTDLDAIVTVDPNWYALALTDRTQATVLSAATWTESNQRLFGTASSDPDIINEGPGTDTTSIAYQLQNAGYSRSFCLYQQDAGDNVAPGPGLDYPECAWFGTVLWTDPGSETWALKGLNLVAYSQLTSNQSGNCRNKFSNTYEYIGGQGVTRDGKVSANEYIDIVRGIDWLTSTIQTNVFGVLVNNSPGNSKVPYTDAGIAAIQAQIERALDQAVNSNFIVEDSYEVFVPLAANVSPTDKANRVLNGVTFQATLAGAIQVVNIRGTLTF